MKITNYKLLETLNNISKNYETLNSLKGPTFLYTILHNIKILEEKLQNLNEIIKPSDKYNEYQNKRIEVCETYADKDEDGNPIKINNNGVTEFKIDMNDMYFNNEIKNLQETYKTEIDDYLKQIDNYNKELEKEIEVEFLYLELKDIPNDITFELMNTINLFIKNNI